MFKQSIKVSSADQARRELNIFHGELSKASLEEPARTLLKEQVTDTLLQYERQLSPDRAQHFKSDRVFEGDGYKVKVSADSRPREGFLAKVTGLLGFN